MSQPLCPHGNYDTTCPLCENVWDERSPLAPREAPWHEKEGVVPEAPAHTTKKDVPDAAPPVFKPTCSSCKNELDDNGRCDNLVCASNLPRRQVAKKKKETAAERGYPIPGDYRVPTEAPLPRRMKSPFSFGPAVLEVTPTSLYDSIVIDHRAPNIYSRLFTDTTGKRDQDISPHIGSGGSLPAPRMFVMDHLRFFLTPQAFYADPREEKFDRDQLLLNTMIEFNIGVRYYYQGLLAMLPKTYATKLAIPPQQCFYANVSISNLPALNVDWKMMLVLDGEIGTEIN